MALDIESDLELWWKCNDDPGQDVLLDYSGGSIGNGALAANDSLIDFEVVSDHPNGLAGAIRHKANGGEVFSSGNFAIGKDTNKTITYWQKMNTFANACYVFNTHDGTDYATTLFYPSQDNARFLPGISTANPTDFEFGIHGVNPDYSGWSFWAWVYSNSVDGDDCIDIWYGDAENALAYRGSRTPVGAINAAYPTNNPVGLFERDGGGTWTGDMLMADVRVYSRALSNTTLKTDPDGNIAALFAYEEPNPGGEDDAKDITKDLAANLSRDLAA